jgi:hypothetical protein
MNQLNRSPGMLSQAVARMNCIREVSGSMSGMALAVSPLTEFYHSMSDECYDSTLIWTTTASFRVSIRIYIL